MVTETKTTRHTAGAAPGAKPVEETEAILGVPEPWETWETRLVTWSISIGIVGLVVLGTLINLFLLHK